MQATAATADTDTTLTTNVNDRPFGDRNQDGRHGGGGGGGGDGGGGKGKKRTAAAAELTASETDKIKTLKVAQLREVGCHAVCCLVRFYDRLFM